MKLDKGGLLNLTKPRYLIKTQLQLYGGHMVVLLLLLLQLELELETETLNLKDKKDEKNQQVEEMQLLMGKQEVAQAPMKVDEVSDSLEEETKEKLAANSKLRAMDQITW